MNSVSVSLHQIGEPASHKPHGLPLLRLGFRPFYILGALFAAIAIPIWMLVYFGKLNWTSSIPPLLWHAHEMLMGFVCAIIIGFLLTAGKAWTGLQTPRGASLGALALLWVAARLSAWFATYQIYALLDSALLFVVAAIFARLLWRAKNTRNLPIAVIVLALAIANLCFHLGVLNWLSIEPLRALYAVIVIITLIETVIAGRVIPGFTMSANPGLKIITHVKFEKLIILLTVLAGIFWVALPNHWLSGIALSVAAVLHVWRWAHWQTSKVLDRPILWILHFSYAWLPLGLSLLAAAQFGWLSISIGIHALMVGATAGLIIGMITRTARGHTGRLLAVSAIEVSAYSLLIAAAVLRVFVPWLLPAYSQIGLIIAATCWSFAFLIYLWQYTPWLMQTRIDGKDG